MKAKPPPPRLWFLLSWAAGSEAFFLTAMMLWPLSPWTSVHPPKPPLLQKALQGWGGACLGRGGRRNQIAIKEARTRRDHGTSLPISSFQWGKEEPREAQDLTGALPLPCDHGVLVPPKAPRYLKSTQFTCVSFRFLTRNPCYLGTESHSRLSDPRQEGWPGVHAGNQPVIYLINSQRDSRPRFRD